MDLQQHFKEHEGKLRFEALLKALLLGIIVGSAVGFIAAAVSWITSFSGGLWLSLGLFVVFTATATLLFYLKIFKPSVISNARRLDRLGLDERLVTMVEYQNDDSYMAAVQREDAAQQLNHINSKDVRIKIPLKYTIGASISFVFFTALWVVLLLIGRGIIPTFDKLVESLTPEEPDVFLSVVYDVDEGGYIDGESDQLVLKGTDAEPVLAVADDGYVFVEWSDGRTDPYRYDKDIVEELEIFATFEPSDEEGDDEGEEGDGEEAEEEQDGEPGDEESDEPSDSEQEPEESEAGKYKEANQIIDGATYYMEKIEEYKEYLLQYLEEHRGELSEEEIAIIESYIGIV